LNVDPAGYAGRLDAAGRPDVYGNLVASFRIWWVSLFYIVAMVAVGMHLFHGAWSAFRTMGYAPRSVNPLKRRLALLLAAGLWLGFTIVPVAVLAGLVR
jgi:succinate dehydrogenase / fumarate reductase, cytochrome b subunit